MNNHNFNQIHLKIQFSIQNYSHSGASGYNNEIKQEANRFVDAIKPEVSELIAKLKSRAIACYDIEEFLLSKRESINLNFLNDNGINEENIAEIKNDILRLIAAAIMNSYLDSLFTSQKSISKATADLYLN
jgi:hypothetical protein